MTQPRRATRLRSAARPSRAPRRSPRRGATRGSPARRRPPPATARAAWACFSSPSCRRAAPRGRRRGLFRSCFVWDVLRGGSDVRQLLRVARTACRSASATSNPSVARKQLAYPRLSHNQLFGKSGFLSAPIPPLFLSPAFRSSYARAESASGARGPKYGFSDFGPEITRDATKRIVCSSANTFKRSRVYFHYGCGTMRAGAAARSPYKPYKPCLALLPSPPPKRGRRGPRGPAGSSTLPPRHARTADGRERSLAAPWSPPARDAEESASAPPTTHL